MIAHLQQDPGEVLNNKKTRRNPETPNQKKPGENDHISSTLRGKLLPPKIVSEGNPPLPDTSHTLDFGRNGQEAKIAALLQRLPRKWENFQVEPKRGPDGIIESWDSLKLNDLLVRKNWAKHGWTMEQIVEIVAKFSPIFLSWDC